MLAAGSESGRQRCLAWWLALFAGYAAITGIVTQGPSSVWGIWAAAGYGLAALAAWRSRGPALPLLIGLCGAVIGPTIWLSTSLQPIEEPVVVARAAVLLLHHGSPYLPSSQLVSTQSYNPYLPAMSIFGFLYVAGLPGILGNPATSMAVTTIALAALSIGIALPRQAWPKGSGITTLQHNTALAVVTPVLALPIAIGTTDPPIIALMCLALACASRLVASHQESGVLAGAESKLGGAPSRWITWNGLAALAIGSACAMKETAWPAVPVIAAMIAARVGFRAAARFVCATAAIAIILIIVFAPTLITNPGAFYDNIIAYPLGVAHHLTTAASPLPGHLLSGTGSLGRFATLGLLAAGAAGIGVSLVLRPPRDIRAATVVVALGLTLMFTLAPNSRFGYFAYPAALIGWLALARQPPGQPGSGRPRLGHEPFQLSGGH